MSNENITIEYKKSLALLKEGVISLSAMLNKEHIGNLYFGFDSNKNVYKVDTSKKTLSDISNEIRTNLKPLPSRIDINIEKVEDVDIIHVYVEGEDTPYSAYNRYYIRIDEGDITMTNSLLQKFFEEKEDNYSKWEEKPTPYLFSDIDEDLLMNVIREANDKGRLDYVYKDVEQALTKLNLITNEGKIKTAGYYLFGKGKPVTLKEAIYPTDSRSEFGEIKEFKGNIFECINEGLSYIKNHITYKSDIIGIQRVETPEIPIKAIREILINSFVHRKYNIKEDFNQIVILKSSLRIYNPGGIYKNIDPMKFARSEVGSKIRNVLIASVLYKCGYIDAFGTGFSRTFSLCTKNDVQYEYRNDEFGFTFMFNRNPNFLTDKINDKINDKIKYKMDSVDDAILDEIKLNKFITIPEISQKVGKSESTIARHIRKLSSDSMIKRAGSRKTGYWSL